MLNLAGRIYDLKRGEHLRIGASRSRQVLVMKYDRESLPRD